MTGLFVLFDLALWYLLDIFKEVWRKVADQFKLNDLVYNVVVWVLAIVGGVLIAVQFKLDAFVLVGEITNLNIAVEPSVLGYVFGGLMLSGGSGVVNKLLKALKDKELTPPKE